MVLIYTPVFKPRIRYIFVHFFRERMMTQVSFTSELSVFIAHSGPKMSYGDAPLGNEFFVAAHGLLHEQGVGDQEIEVIDWDGLPVFFTTTSHSMLPFDFFSAAFYLLSRYEEYLPFVPDRLGRFTSTSALASTHDFLHLPLVDLWFERFVTIWIDFFDLPKPTPASHSLSLVVEVPELYTYKLKPLLRSFFEGAMDFFQLKLARVFDRLMVLLGIREDPLADLLNWVEQLHLDKINTRFFVLYTWLGVHDRNLSMFNKVHQQEVKSISDYVPTGPLASYASLSQPNSLSGDINRFASLLHRPVTAIRQHKLVLRFPHTYRNYTSLGVKNDFSMQYSDCSGFRASTAFPFRFYDIGDEQQTPLLIHPICLSEDHIRQQRYSRKMRQLFLAYQTRLKEMNAPFVVALSNRSFNSRSYNQSFLATLKKLLGYE